ncbi:hypothetical protein WICPIJ_006329 [Wickerhamomyces pijperi]|uniref:Uncharacterized protein n=1 Tax=Wickerhamomyces pijperi TaxID=599730 RepID=A0A9P8TLH7_WICPI|nr:hypothetical protein WICPIJ_006329 [Wickerhamomyces pijperi]
MLISSQPNSVTIWFKENSTPLEIMFIPIASPVILQAPALFKDGKETTGPRVIPSLVKTVVVPPPKLIALQPRMAEATRQPSVVAIGMWYGLPSMIKGPATPTGRGM